MHAASFNFEAIVVIAEDTDVMVLCLAFQKDIQCPIYLKRGTVNRTRSVDINKLTRTLGERICISLIGLHSFTGCDTVGALAGRRKLCALKLLTLARLPSLLSYIVHQIRI